MNCLDLYAKIEPLIGFYEEYEELYAIYLRKISALHVKSILDIGCGNGKFLQHLKRSGYNSLGIDISEQMVEIACKLGVNAKVLDIDEVNDRFDCITAIGDVVNYISADELKSFFQSVKKGLKQGGYFLFDVNTLAGFETTEGIMIRDFKNKFLTIESDFYENVLDSKIVYFEKEKDFYKRYNGRIMQYYHNLEKFEKDLEGFEFISSSFVSMFDNEDEKAIITLRAI